MNKVNATFIYTIPKWLAALPPVSYDSNYSETTNQADKDWFFNGPSATPCLTFTGGSLKRSEPGFDFLIEGGTYVPGDAQSLTDWKSSYYGKGVENQEAEGTPEAITCFHVLIVVFDFPENGFASHEFMIGAWKTSRLPCASCHNNDEAKTKRIVFFIGFPPTPKEEAKYPGAQKVPQSIRDASDKSAAGHCCKPEPCSYNGMNCYCCSAEQKDEGEKGTNWKGDKHKCREMVRQALQKASNETGGSAACTFRWASHGDSKNGVLYGNGFECTYDFLITSLSINKLIDKDTKYSTTSCGGEKLAEKVTKKFKCDSIGPGENNGPYYKFTYDNLPRKEWHKGGLDVGF